MNSIPPLGPAPLPPPPRAPAPAQRRIPVWVIVVVGLMACIVAAVGGLAWWGWQAFEQQAVTAMAADPVIAGHIGGIRSSKFDWAKTSAEPDEDTFVFHVRGERGSGTVVARFITVDADSEAIDGGVLIMQDGTRLPLRGGSPPDDSGDGDGDGDGDDGQS